MGKSFEIASPAEQHYREVINERFEGIVDPYCRISVEDRESIELYPHTPLDGFRRLSQ